MAFAALGLLPGALGLLPVVAASDCGRFRRGLQGSDTAQCTGSVLPDGESAGFASGAFAGVAGWVFLCFFAGC